MAVNTKELPRIEIIISGAFMALFAITIVLAQEILCSTQLK